MGFEVEGIKKNSIIIDDRFVDEYYMAKIYWANSEKWLASCFSSINAKDESFVGYFWDFLIVIVKDRDTIRS